jgi:2-keto-4-pentenoate hydratase
LRHLIYGTFLAALSAAALAHHATVTNFTREVISVDGVIEQVRYQNPHASILIKNTASDGKETYWLVETAARTTLERKGITLDVLTAGSQVTASGLKGRRANTMYLKEIRFDDGRVFTPDAESVTVRDANIRRELAQMADDFVNLRAMKGFDYEMDLDEAYRWQDEMVAIMEPEFGEIVGYKTGGHNVGPTFPTFPPGGIRAYLLEGFMREDGFAVRPGDTNVGFLEADFAFRVGDSSINNAETDLEILAGLDAIIPFAEVPDPYYEPDTRSVNGTIVSNMGSRYSVSGDPLLIEGTDEWLDRINNFEFAVLDEDDTVIQTGQVKGWYEPVTVVRWIRDQLRESGKELVPGQILSLGNIGILRPLQEGNPRGPLYTSDQFRLEYYGLKDDGPITVTINVDRR